MGVAAVFRWVEAVVVVKSERRRAWVEWEDAPEVERPVEEHGRHDNTQREINQGEGERD